MRTDELDFELPPELIAQEPGAERAASRLLHYRRADRSIAHRQFADLPQLLRPGDLLVMNDTRVLPARLTLRKETGGRIEGLFLREVVPGRWRVMLKGLGHYAGPMTFVDRPDLQAAAVWFGQGGEYEIELKTDQPAARVLAEVGRMPLPPYIKRQKEHDDRDELDRQRYQTVYAREGESVAAPTAGLHFSPAVFEQLDRMGVERAFVTLTVGMGTFKPVASDTLEGHIMHSEQYRIPPEAAEAINRAKEQGRRVIAVGTTSARVLESQPAGPIEPREAETSIFIYPPYQWRHVDALITNFHLPRSTLIALVAAMVGLEEQRRIYREAIAARYRFFSYGDAMFVD